MLLANFPTILSENQSENEKYIILSNWSKDTRHLPEMVNLSWLGNPFSPTSKKGHLLLLHLKPPAQYFKNAYLPLNSFLCVSTRVHHVHPSPAILNASVRGTGGFTIIL